jgi:signal transduction histidine kinase
VTDFQVDGSSLDLIIQVSNFHHRRGGAWEKLTLGKVQDLRVTRSKRINYDVFLFGSILVMAFYHLGLFFLRRKEKAPLFFSVFCFLICMRILTTGERYLMEIYPAINWQLFAKLEYLSYYLGVPAFTQFVHQLFSHRLSKKFCNIVNATALFFSAAVIFLPVNLFSHTLPAYHFFTLLILFYALYVFISESMKKEVESIIFLAGFIIIFLAVINDMLNNEAIIQTGDLIPLGLFLFIFSQAFMQSLRFSRAFSTVASQRQQMRKTNQALQNEIAERHQAEKELKESHKRFLNVLDSIDADVYVADMDTYEILFMNRHIIDTFKQDLTGQICWRVFRNESGPCDFCTNHKLLNAAGQPGDVQIWEAQNPITKRWYVNYDRAIHWDKGHIVKLQVATDVTSRKLAEVALKQANEDLEKRVDERTEELLQANEQLQLEIEERKQAQQSTKRAQWEAEKANEAKSEFLANMSHELRTPMNHILGFTELILDENFGKLNQVQTEYLSDVHSSASHLLSLINDILDLSKIEAGKYELEPSSVNLKDLLENSLTMVKEKALKHGIMLSKHFRDLPDSITADERKLKQIMYNLLSNAVKFTPDGGSVSVKALSSDDSHGDIGNKHKAPTDGIVIRVSDTGIGLKSDDLKRIFNSFEQVENSASRNFQGTGLGLSLTKKLVELHGGKIWVESGGVGKGTTFSFTIPAKII